MHKDSKIYVAGHTGMVGSAIVRRLEKGGFTNILTAAPPAGTSRVAPPSQSATPNPRPQTPASALDLTSQSAVNSWFEQNRPDYVFLAAARVGGILANATYPADFFYDNMVIETNVIHASKESGVQRLLFLGSSCIYPRDCPQPIKEEYLLTGPLEKTNEAYAIAKISGLKMCEYYRQQYDCDFISVMPTNLYGPNDNFDLKTSHVLPALIRKFHEAKIRGEKEVVVWGTGAPRREFLHVDDLADACLFVMEHLDPRDQGPTPSALEDPNPYPLTPNPCFLNIGTGTDLSIKDLAELIREIVHPEAEIIWDTSRPDGTPRKLLDVSRLRDLGWKESISLEQGIRSTYDWYRSRVETLGREGAS